MRKTPQLREVLPIYPAMPFSPLARFAAAGAIRTVGKRRLPLRGGLQENSSPDRQQNGADLPNKRPRHVAAPPFHQHCSGPDKGPDIESKCQIRNPNKSGAAPISDFDSRASYFSIWHWAIWRSTIELSRRSAILGGGRHREESAAGHFLNDERGRMKDERRVSF